ncbi:hypothetical protein [Paractinoplanes rishiriensis]|uniref:Uncharacterized protein n=1 Tax=Paractinoplanes rishiriensis TaxID=1050105 RepID=A0A919N2J1_9ACTN|nr:hypothetical protein [Actinoplanes rishiriensis]GIF00403.1 hypothetical protein Ari01nite_78670 [Actinoplanes rishiriensis]
MPIFALDRPDVTGRQIAPALRSLGDEHVIPETLIRIATEYFERYADERGQPVFSGGSYFSTVDETVNSTSWTIGFVRLYRGAARLVTEGPLVDEELVGQARRLLAEAEHVFDMELMSGSRPGDFSNSLAKVRMHLERGRALLGTRPGTTVALAGECLLLLDVLAAARQEMA